MSTRRAARAFEAFKGERPARLRRSRLPDQDVTGWEMGPLLGVAYEARRDGETQRYFHEFKKTARPKLVASADGRQLYIDGGRFKVTDRGVEDMPNLFVVNPSPRSGRSKPKGKGSSMARRARRRRSTSIFVTNPRRRRRSTSRRRAPRIFARNPARRRRRRASGLASRRVYRRNPARRSTRRSSARRRSYRRNPVNVTKLSNMLMPAVFIGLGGVATEVACAYLPIPIAWKTGPMRYIVKGAVGVGIGLILANGFKQRRIGYYFAAGAVAIATHDFVKAWLNSQSTVPIKGLGYVNPAAVARFGQYTRALPSNRFGEYTRPLRSQFGGAAPIPGARSPGGEMNFAA